MTDVHNIDAVRDESGRVLEGPYKHLRVLDRRMKYLQGRVEKGEREGKMLTHDRHEMEALQWAVDVIYRWVDLPEKE